MVLSVGGWNNDLINRTETYRFNAWSIIENKTEVAIRSSAVIQLNAKPYLVGGVTCTGGETERKICRKVTDIYEFSEDDMEWQLTTFQLTVPRSSHLIMHAPITYFSSCTDTTTD